MEKFGKAFRINWTEPYHK